jgi:hypothetical protein
LRFLPLCGIFHPIHCLHLFPLDATYLGSSKSINKATFFNLSWPCGDFFKQTMASVSDIRIFISLIDGDTLPPIEAKATDTIHSLKQRVFELRGIPVENQILKDLGTTLDNCQFGSFSLRLFGDLRINSIVNFKTEPSNRTTSKG